MSSGSSTTTTFDPEMTKLVRQNMQRATAIAEYRFQPFTGQLTAPLSVNESQASSAALGGANVGAYPLTLARDSAASNLGFNPQSVGAGDLIAGIQKYQNPYTDDVIGRTMQNLEFGRQGALTRGAQAASAAHAFGGSRHGVADAMTNEAFARTGADTVANLRRSGFDVAAGLAGSDAARALAAAQSNQSANIAGAGIRANAADQLGRFSDQESRMYHDYIRSLLVTGGNERQAAQSATEAAYSEFLRSVNYPIEGQQLISQALGLAQNSQGTSSKSKSDQTAAIAQAAATAYLAYSLANAGTAAVAMA